MAGLDGFVGERELATPDDMHELGIEFGRNLSAGDLVVLTGPLGAGKTTLTRGIAEGLGVRGPVQSPTFVIARTHPSLVGGPALIHADAYRMGDGEELDDLDLDFERSVTVVEWGLEKLAAPELWWEVVIDREALADLAGDELDADSPRLVRVIRHEA